MADPKHFISLALVATLCVAACGKGNKKEDRSRVIELGLFVEFEDSDSELEISKANMAAEEINDAGGIRIGDVDYRIEFVPEGHEASAEGGVRAVESFQDRGITAALGPPWSSIALGNEPDGSDGAAAAARDAGILLVSGSATSPAISALDDNDLMWRTAPSDALQTVLAANYLRTEKGLSRAALLVRDEAWGRGLAEAFTREFERAGGQVVGVSAYDVSGTAIEDLDNYAYENELEQVFANAPDVVLLASFGEVFQITNRIVQAGYLDAYGDAPPLFFGADATFTKDLLGNGAPEVLRNMEGASALADTTSEGFNQLISKFEDLKLGVPDNFDAARYDAVYCLALAMQAAQSKDAHEMAAAMQEISRPSPGDLAVGVDDWKTAREALLDGQGIDYEGASGPINFDDNGDPTVGYFVLWKVIETGDGTFEYDLSNNVRFPEE